MEQGLAQRQARWGSRQDLIDQRSIKGGCATGQAWALEVDRISSAAERLFEPERCDEPVRVVRGDLGGRLRRSGLNGLGHQGLRQLRQIAKLGRRPGPNRLSELGPD